MLKYTRIFSYLAVLVMFLLALLLMQRCAFKQLDKSQSIKTTPLIGLSYHGNPCSNILVPASLPETFIVNADKLVIDYQNFANICRIVFTEKGQDWIITVFATRACPAFIMMDFYSMKTEKSQKWLWNPKGEIRTVNEEEWKLVMSGLTPNFIDQYCPKLKLNSFVLIADQRIATFDGKIGPYYVLSWEKTWYVRVWPLNDKGIETVYINPNSESKFWKGTVVQDKDGKILAYTYKEFDGNPGGTWYQFIYNEERNHFELWDLKPKKV